MPLCSFLLYHLQEDDISDVGFGERTLAGDE